MGDGKKIIIAALVAAIGVFTVLFISTIVSAKNEGTEWIVAAGTPTSLHDGKVGDMYLDSKTYDLYKKQDSGWIHIGNIKGKDGVDGFTPTVEISEDGYWVINGTKTKVSAKGIDGKNGKNGKDGSSPELTIGKNGNWYINGKNTGKKALATDGKDGVTGKDGTSVYIGYDGYLWSGSERTNYQVEKVIVEEGIVESTIGIEKEMSKYFKNGYVDLKDNYVALMANFKENALLTQYSKTTISEIKVVTDSAGKLSIGTAKVADIVSARTKGKELTVSTKEYDVIKGLNTLQVEIEVAEDETIVFGGNNSVSLYYTQGIKNEDEQGNYSLINGKSNTTLLDVTEKVNNKLAIQVKLGEGEEKPIFEDITTVFPNTTSWTVYTTATNPFSYIDVDYYSGKKITKIGVPITTVSAIDENQFYTIYIVDKNSVKVGQKANIRKTIKIKIPKEEIGTSTTLNRWVYVDVRDYEIELAEDETLAFFSDEDTAKLGYSTSNKDSKYLFYMNLETTISAASANILWDIYYEEKVSLENILKELEEKEQIAIRENQLKELSTLLKDKNVSILGDSISTFPGYSNNATTSNSTIGSNALYYNGSNYITDVNDTWWMQTINQSGTKLLVDNAWSGDKVTGRGQTRCLQLHDDTGENAGTNPDIIIVYLGINDFRGSVATATFETSYDTMIKNMTEKYTEAEVFLMNFVPNGGTTSLKNMEAYNKVVADTAKKYGATLVDLYNESGINQTTMTSLMGDSGALHPNVAGMTVMADTVIDTMLEYYIK